MEVWSSTEAGERWRGLIDKISGARGLWVGLQASVSCVQYIFVIHIHGGFGSGVITWFGYPTMLWAMGWAMSISE